MWDLYGRDSTESESAADDPVTILLLDLGCRANWHKIIDAAVSRPLHSL